MQNYGYRNKNEATTLIANMAKFKCYEGIYKLEYNEDFNSPLVWWKFVDNNNNNNILRKIALKLFAIVPHSASCERVFSGLGWFYGTRRQNLSTTTIESMSKIRHFYLTHAQNELQYDRKNYTEEELVKIMKESDFFNNDELEVNNQNSNIEYEVVDIDEIPQNEVYVLIMARDIDLTVFDNEVEGTQNIDDNNQLDNENEKNNDDDDDNTEEYDVNEIINNVSF